MNGGITGINGNGANIFATRRTQFGDNPFLELLVTQMRTQSPLDPVDNDSFMTQVSQLSSMNSKRSSTTACSPCCSSKARWLASKG